LSILTLIPARGGSKGIPRKNIRVFEGKPLIAWTIAAAKESRYPMRIVCSTDDSEIASVAAEFGAETPWLRPDDLATDEASTYDVALHAIEAIGREFTHLLLLQPTSPLRVGEDIDGAIEMALVASADAVVSVTDSPAHPYLTYRIGLDNGVEPFCRPAGVSLRRQDLPPAYVLNGALYFNRIESLREHGTFFPSNTLAYRMPNERSIDIDGWEDWHQAELALKQRPR
jgi:CMP-N-acetylneuraminic acid synthetase